MAKSERKKPEANASESRLDFESQFEQLTECVTNLESGRLSLDESLNTYRTGIELVARCRTILDQAQARVESIESVGEDGEPLTSGLDLEVESHAALRKPEAGGPGSDSLPF